MLSNSTEVELHHQIAGDLLKPTLHPAAGNYGSIVKMCGIMQHALHYGQSAANSYGLRAMDAVNRLDVGGALGLKI